jgi:hypothetical protein
VSDSHDSLFVKENPFEELAVVYVLYFDEVHGHTPILIFPDERYKNDSHFMRPIKYHPIWFLSEGSDALNHIDLEYKGYTFFGKKFFTKSKRIKRRAGLNEETPETIVIILSLPTNLEIFGDELIKELTDKIEGNFGDKLFEIIESEIASDNIVKSPKMDKIIEKGTAIKKDLIDCVDKTCRHFFDKAVSKLDNSSIKMQKAISFLALKGIDISHIESSKYKNSFSNVKLFDPTKKNDLSLLEITPFTIKKITYSQDSEEIEFIVQNNSDEELKNLAVEITHVKEFFEKEILTEKVENWYPKEELVFISPVYPHITEYLFFIIDQNTKERLLSKRIDLNTLEN